MTRKHLVHYKGALEYTRADGQTVSILAGYAACCSGRRAERVAAKGNHTLTPEAVTCRGCLTRMRMAALR